MSYARGGRHAPILLVLLVSFSACRRHGAPLHLSATPPAERYEHLLGPYRVPTLEEGCAAPELRGSVTVPPFPAPVFDVMGIDYYTDTRHSEIDPALKARNEAVEAPLRDFGRSLMRLSDAYLRSRARDPTLATRALDGLFSWASADALLGRVNRAGLDQIQWALGAYALDYLKIRDDSGLDARKKARVERWFRQLAAERMSYAAQHPDWPDHANNHAYWAGMAVAAVGIAASDRNLFDWGIGQFSLFLGQVRADGALPLEMARGKRALKYHLFAVAPLVMLAELGEVNGVHLYDAGDRALDRLVARCLAGVADPKSFAAAAGAEQLLPDDSDLAWIEIYYARTHAPIARSWLKARPFVSGFLGGDLCLAFSGR